MASKHSPLLIFSQSNGTISNRWLSVPAMPINSFSLTKALPKKIFALRSGKMGETVSTENKIVGEMAEAVRDGKINNITVYFK